MSDSRDGVRVRPTGECVDEDSGGGDETSGGGEDEASTDTDEHASHDHGLPFLREVVLP